MASADIAPSVQGVTGRIAQLVSLRVGKLPTVIWLYILTIALPIGFKLGPLSMSLMRLLLIVMVIPLVVMLFSKRAGRIIPTDILFALHILWAALAIGANNPDRVVENMGSTAIEFVGGYLLGRIFIRTPETFLALCRALFIFIACTIPFALLENKSGSPIILKFIESLPGLTSFADVNNPKRMGLERAQVMFAHPIHYGVFCSIMFAMAFVAFRGIFSDVTRYVVAGVVALAAFLSLSSGALLAILMQGALIGWAWVFRSNPARWKILLGLLAAMYVAVDLASNRTPIDVFMSYATFSAHNAFWRGIIFDWGMFNVWQNPILGLGLRQWVRPHYMGSGSMDNFWLVMAVRYGIPGFLFIALGYLDLLRRVALRDLSGDEALSRIRLAWMFTFIGLTFSLCTVHVWTSVYSFLFFMAGAGVWLTDYQPARATQAAAPAPTRAATPHARIGAAPVYARGRPAAPEARAELRHSRDQSELEPPPPAPPVADFRRADLKFTRFSRTERPSDTDPEA